MAVPLVSPRFATMHGAFFPSRCTIEVKTIVEDPYGQEVETFADAPGLVDIPCAKAPLSAMERQAAGYTATDRVWTVLLIGAFPQTTTRHRATVDGETFDIDAVETDQTGSLTRLRVRQVTT